MPDLVRIGQSSVVFPLVKSEGNVVTIVDPVETVDISGSTTARAATGNVLRIEDPDTVGRVKIDRPNQCIKPRIARGHVDIKWQKIYL